MFLCRGFEQFACCGFGSKCFYEEALNSLLAICFMQLDIIAAKLFYLTMMLVCRASGNFTILHSLCLSTFYGGQVK